jgi:hypothetical protein
MRKLICWTSGQEIVKGKFLHCTACGVNYSQDCLQSLNFSIGNNGVTRPKPDDYYHICILPDKFSPWMDIGRVTEYSTFFTYLMQLIKSYPQKISHGVPKVYFLCNSCHVDIEFRLADASLYQILATARKSNTLKVTCPENQIRSFESIDFISTLTEDSQQMFQNLVKINLSYQLEIINMVMGTNWRLQRTADVWEIVSQNF